MLPSLHHDALISNRLLLVQVGVGGKDPSKDDLNDLVIFSHIAGSLAVLCEIGSPLGDSLGFLVVIVVIANPAVISSQGRGGKKRNFIPLSQGRTLSPQISQLSSPQLHWP